MSDADVQTQALAVVDRYLAALNARDSEAIRAAFNFPHLRVGAKGNLARYETPADYDFGHFFRATSRDRWHHTKWDKTEAVFVTVGKVHVAVDFTRPASLAFKSALTWPGLALPALAFII